MWLAAAVNVEETNKNKKLDKLVRKQCDQMLKSKVAQNFPNVTQKVPTVVFTKKGCFKEIANPKVTKHVGYFCNENYAQEIQKNRLILSQDCHQG